jgi:two-component system chemotaxis response regulator CheY
MKCLVVEDDRVSRKVMEGYLGKFGDVVTAENGMQGAVKFIDALAKGEPFNLVCLDVMMPKLDGTECLKLIREAEAEYGLHGLDGTPVIMTTCVEQPKGILTAFKIGCEGYIVKPVDRDDLISKVKQLGVVSKESEAE